MRHALLCSLTLLLACGSPEPDPNGANGTNGGNGQNGGDDTVAVIDFVTTLGPFSVVIDGEAAPITTANFLSYVDSGFYDGSDGEGATTFHRVIPDFMAQGGGLLASGARKATGSPIVIESDNGLQNRRGTVAMARTNDPNSATSQFFVNVVDNDFLNYQDAQNPGYAVFGEVRSGMDTIDAIVAVARDGNDQPDEPIVITSCERAE